MPVCHVCKGDTFTVNAGFSYCDDCGTQAPDVQELQYDTYFEGIENRLGKVNIKVVSERQDLKLTTWEEFNYIIIGLVNELINLGAKPELKLTTLQLWSAYLRLNEAAFFSRTSIKIPKLSASFKKRDAEIIYNLRKEKRKRRRASRTTTFRTASAKSQNSEKTSASSARSTNDPRRFRRTQRTLMNAEYDAYQTELETNTSMSVLNRSSEGSSSHRASSRTSLDSTAPVAIEFSRLSRRLLKKSMPKKHLRRHEHNAQLDCHAFTRNKYARGYHPEILARNTVFELLYLALNQIGDPLQLGDMLRYIKEGHLTFNNILKFFPVDMSFDQKFELYNQFNLSSISCPASSHVRYGAQHLVRLLGVRLRPPNMVALTGRYCAELALPPTVHRLIETLLTICPPRMRLVEKGKQQLPLYEGRAVAYIMFAMKLLFGLDDERELRMSKSAQRINRQLRKLPGGDGVDGEQPRSRPLFVWTEWMRYLEMRNVILAQCHYATAHAVQPNAAAENAPLYADFLRTYHEEADLGNRDAADTRRKNDRTCMANMSVIFASAQKLHEQEANVEAEARAKEKTKANGAATQTRTALRFEPTLLPKSTYMERLLEDTVMANGVHIPVFMHTDHTARDVVPFLRPNELRRQLAGVQRVRVVRLSGVHRFRIEPPFKCIWPEEKKPFTNHMRLSYFNHDIDDEDWQTECRKTEQSRSRSGVQARRQLGEAVHNNLEAMKAELDAHRKSARLAREVGGPTKPTSADEVQPVDASAFIVAFDEAETVNVPAAVRTPQKSQGVTIAVDVTPDLNGYAESEMFSQLESQGISAAQVPRCDPVDATVSNDSETTSPRKNATQAANDPGQTAAAADDSDSETIPPPSPRRECDEDAVPLFEMVLSDDNDEEEDEDSDSDSDDDFDPPLEFCVNDFDYWLCAGRLDEMRLVAFKDLCQRMPQNFVWLLRQCAQLVECNERDVYRELLVVENFYAYRLAPVQRMRNMLLYQAIRRPLHIPELKRIIVKLSSLW